MDRKTERKDETKEKSRVDFFSVPQKWKFWYFCIGSVLGNFIVFATIFQECDEEWLEILGLVGKNVAAVAAVLALLFATLESLIGLVELIVKLNQRRLERRMARSRKIAEKIRGEVARGVRNPQSFDDELEKQAFRLLEKHRPLLFFQNLQTKKQRIQQNDCERDSMCNAK